MVEQFLGHIREHNLADKTDKILLAVSGGLDSMTMLHLFIKSPFSFGVAHCNFQLRGDDSDGDEALVREYCHAHNLKFHSTRFDVDTYRKQTGASMQMAARDLRYEWFRHIMEEGGYSKLATAHHASDNLETVLLNLIRGTGVKGLSGIPVKNDRIIRPLLCFTREQLKHYAEENGVSWREDSSNSKDVYGRNLIRNKIVPLMKSLNPDIEHGVQDTIRRIGGSARLLDEFVSRLQDQVVRHVSGRTHFSIVRINQSASPDVLLWYLLKPFGFSYTQCRMIVCDHVPGKIFLTPTHRLTIDREEYILQERSLQAGGIVSLDEVPSVVHEFGRTLSLEESTVPDPGTFRESVAFVDFDRIQFPLVWRRWQAGDVFVPLGMSHRKKVSDFLIDKKISMPDKEDVTVLVSNDRIVWVVGHRIADPVRLSAATRRVLKIELLEA